MITLLIATNNRDKFREIQEIFENAPFVLRAAFEFPGAPYVEEIGTTLEDNAALKAQKLSSVLKLPALADDTGLFVETLGGAPGVFSARFAGEGCTYADNVKKLLEALNGVPLPKRLAVFRTVVAFCEPGGKPVFFEGEVPGVIPLEARGTEGFGYDPVFQPLGFHQTFAEMSLKDKNAISHRSLAFTRAKQWLCQQKADDHGRI